MSKLLTAQEAEAMYPDCGGTWFCVSDYNPLVESLGHEILLKVEDYGYQGDSRYLFKDSGRYGVLIFGWGSCSGCDALRACSTWQEVADIRNGMIDDTHWFDDAEACLKWFNERDWELQYSWRWSETKDFVERSKAILFELAQPRGGDDSE